VGIVETVPFGPITVLVPLPFGTTMLPLPVGPVSVCTPEALPVFTVLPPGR
jgi:hypothetical protein